MSLTYPVKTLFDILKIDSPSGDEGPLADWLTEYIEKYAPDVTLERWGDSLIALRGEKPQVALFAHLDTTGFTLGYDRQLVSIGSPDPKNGDILRPLGKTQAGQEIIIGSDEEYSLTGPTEDAAPGSRWVYASEARKEGAEIVAPYLDNRGGVWAALQTLLNTERVAVAFTTGEETSGHGAYVCARRLFEHHGITQALISDLTWDTEHIHNGQGVAISLRDRYIPRQSFLTKVLALAEASGIPFQREIEFERRVGRLLYSARAVSHRLGVRRRSRKRFPLLRRARRDLGLAEHGQNAHRADGRLARVRPEPRRPKRKRATRMTQDPAEDPGKPYPWQPLFIGLLLVVTVFLVYSRALTQDFVYLDDDYNVYQNPYLSPSVQFAPLWRHPYFDQYCPLTYTAYGLIALWARLPAPMPDTGATLDPHLFHAALLFLHTLNVVLVFLLLRMLLARLQSKTDSRTGYAAAAGALLFALHPLQVESVAWVTDLQRVLCGTFSLLSAIGYLKHANGLTEPPARRWAYYGAALAMGLAAGLCKPSALSLPLMLLLLDRWFLGRSWRDCLLSVLPWLAAILPFVWLSQRAEPPLPAAVFTPWWTRPFLAGDTLAFYLTKLAAPFSLAIDYGRSPKAITSHWWGYATWLLPEALMALVFFFRRGRPWLVGACLLSLAVLLPVLGFMPFTFAQYSIASDRYVYLALLGPAILFAIWLSAKGNRLTWALSGTVLAALAVFTFFQVRVWDNSPTLFSHALAVNPRSPIAHYDLGNFYLARDDYAHAITEFQAAADSDPFWQDPDTNLGVAFAREGEYAHAAEAFEATLRIDPNDAVAKTDLERAKALMQDSRQ